MNETEVTSLWDTGYGYKKNSARTNYFAGLGVSSGEGETGTNLNAAFDTMLTKQMEVASQMISGQLPSEVREQIEIMSAEKGIRGGLGQSSPAARALVARDLGLTSLQMSESGMAHGKALMELAEKKRQWQKEYALNTQSYLDSVRKTDIAWAEQVETRRQFNLKQNLLVNEYMIDVAKFGMELAYSYRTNKASGTSMPTQSVQDIGNILSDLKNLLK